MNMKKKLLLALAVVSILYWFSRSHEEAVPESGSGQTEQQPADLPAEEHIPAQSGRAESKKDQGDNALIADVLRQVNEMRRQQGVPPLSIDPTLCQAAQKRAEELGTLFSHNRPDGTTCFSVFDEMNIPYHSVAENIAQGQRTSDEVVRSWRNSQGHYRNMIGSDFRKIGIGYDAKTHSWVQLFKD